MANDGLKILFAHLPSKGSDDNRASFKTNPEVFIIDLYFVELVN